MRPLPRVLILQTAVSVLAGALVAAATLSPLGRLIPTAQAATLLNDTFDRPDSNVIGNGWSQTGTATAAARIRAGALLLDSRDDPAAPVVSRQFDRLTSGSLQWGFTMDWARTGTEATYEVRMQLIDSGAASAPGGGNAGVAVDLRWGGAVPGAGDQVLAASTGAGTFTPVAPVAGRAAVIVVADLNARTARVTVTPPTGTPATTTVALGAVSGIDSVRLFSSGLNDRKFAGRTFDDLRIDSGSGPTTTTQATPSTTTTTRPTTTTTTTTTTRSTTTSSAPAGSNDLSISGNRLLLSGSLTEINGIRLSSAPLSDSLTNDLIAQLPTYKSYDVRGVAIYYMGGLGISADPFSANGTSVDQTVQRRVDRIIAAADDQGMVVVVGIFYQGAKLKATNAESVRNIVRTVAGELRGEKNVIVNLINEQNSSGYSDTASVYDFRNTEQALRLCDVYAAADPDMIVGIGGYDPVSNDVFADDPRCDILTANNGDSGERYDRYVAAGLSKPMINVEILGGRTQPTKGVFSGSEQALYINNIADAASRTGLAGVFFHNKQWIQESPYRYDLGGNGSAGSPGIRWWFEAARDS